jgi:HD-like signal output (HDOD) protein
MGLPAQAGPSLEVELLTLVASGGVKLPPYPAVTQRLRELIANDDFALKDIGRVVSADQVLSAAVLRAARSPAFRTRVEVVSLDDAISRIGVDVVLELAMAVGLSAYARGGLLDVLRRESWRRAVFAAEIARALAPVFRVDSGEAYTAGLLHDFGEILVYACLDEIAGRDASMKLGKARCREIAEAHHVDLGILLAERWNLPESVLIAIEQHPLESEAPPAMVALLRTVDRVVERLERGMAAVLAIGDFPFPATARVLLEELLPQLPAIVRDFEPKTGARDLSREVLEREATALRDKKRPAKFTATIQGKRYRGTGIAGDGFEITGPALLAEQTVCEVEIAAPGGSFELWAVIALVERGRPMHRLELSPCALDARTDEEWRRLKGTFPPPLPKSR